MTPIEIVGIIGGLLGIAVSFRKLWPSIKRWWAKIQNAEIASRLEEINEKVDTNAKTATTVHKGMNEKLEFIIRELSFNNGTSIKDALNRIEARQVVTAETQNGMLQLDHRGIFRTDPEGNWVWVNEHLLDIIGTRDTQQALGRGWLTFIHSDDRQRVIKDFYSAVNDNRHYRGEFRFYNTEARKDICIHLDCFVLRGNQDETLGFLGFIVEKEYGCEV